MLKIIFDSFNDSYNFFLFILFKTILFNCFWWRQFFCWIKRRRGFFFSLYFNFYLIEFLRNNWNWVLDNSNFDSLAVLDFLLNWFSCKMKFQHSFITVRLSVCIHQLLFFIMLCALCRMLSLFMSLCCVQLWENGLEGRTMRHEAFSGWFLAWLTFKFFQI